MICPGYIGAAYASSPAQQTHFHMLYNVWASGQVRRKDKGYLGSKAEDMRSVQEFSPSATGEGTRMPANHVGPARILLGFSRVHYMPSGEVIYSLSFFNSHTREIRG